MPEMLEVELYRRSLRPLVGLRIDAVTAPDELWCRAAPDIGGALVGAHIVEVRRHGKVLLVDTDGPVVALRFGMTGRLLVDGRSGVPGLVYGAHGGDPSWIRFGVTVGEHEVVVSDPRRLGSVELDPDLSALGPDAWTVDAALLTERLSRSATPVKSALLDQTRLAGLGNMLADEVLFRSSIAPTRACRSLTPPEWEALAAAMCAALPEMLDRGGSHAGNLPAALRTPGAPCPLDGQPLTRTVIAGRSAIHCSAHQR